MLKINSFINCTFGSESGQKCAKSGKKRAGEIFGTQDEVGEGGTEISEVFREILPRCCVRGQGRRLERMGLCDCTYRRQRSFGYFPIFGKVKKRLERTFTQFPSVERVQNVIPNPLCINFRKRDLKAQYIFIYLQITFIVLYYEQIS